MAPTTNPYAELTIAPDDTNASAWQRACVSAMKSAPYQLEPLLTGNDGMAAECARELALGGLSASSVVGGAGSDGSTGPIDSAAMTRSLIYQASAAALTGRCERSVGLASAPSAPVAPLAGGGAVQSTGAAVEACGRPITGTVVTLPNALAEQGVCGQRVDLSAVSAGDLIFWDYRDSAPTHVGVATGGTQLVTIDPISGRFVQQSMPTANDVRAKRVLGGGM
ncbi:hypothetical protein ACLMAL_16890 [Nocardia sp. CWNU-33]|uniref:hypothetical protein n=1 Tax=Nocardia sp. CWNU-33 TaxID=3392117 RepID=UPI00398EA674